MAGRVEAVAKKVEIRYDYWERVIELIPLLDARSARELGVNAASANLPRRMAKKVRRALAAAQAGPLSLAEVDKIAGMYAVWSVSRKHDWARYPVSVPEGTRLVDQQICVGIWDLDVVLRREIEKLLTLPETDARRAESLRRSVEERAGGLAASLDVGSTFEDQFPRWELIGKEFDRVCRELDALLTLAGSPPSDSVD